jgi:hypothetical protein
MELTAKEHLMDAFIDSINVPVHGISDYFNALRVLKQIYELLVKLGIGKGDLFDKISKVIETIQENLPEILSIVNAILILFGKQPVNSI